MSVPILLYHQIIAPPPKPMPFRSMFVRPASFARQMAWLKLLGYKGLSLREAAPYIGGEKKGKVAAITFDDGSTNVFETAAPILARHGFTATNFIVANQIGGTNAWDHHLGIVETPCMDAGQIRSWVEMGHEIGSHTLDHVHLNAVTDEEARRQISRSRQVLEDLTGTEVTSFAYPHGEQSSRHRHMVEEAGYSCAGIVKRRRSNRNDDPFGLPRITVRRSDTLLQFTSGLWLV